MRLLFKEILEDIIDGLTREQPRTTEACLLSVFPKTRISYSSLNIACCCRHLPQLCQEENKENKKIAIATGRSGCFCYGRKSEKDPHLYLLLNRPPITPQNPFQQKS